jgi:hypothetical protein
MSEHTSSQSCPVAHGNNKQHEQHSPSIFRSEGHAPPDPFTQQPVTNTSFDQKTNTTIKHDSGFNKKQVSNFISLHHSQNS